MNGPDWNAVVSAIHERDRQRCMNCHRDSEDTTLDVHHIVPRGQGGSHRLTNLILLCRQCHDAAHGKTVAPRIKWYTNGEMDSEEFDVFRKLFNELHIARFDDDERCWYIPLADAERLIESDKNGPADVESAGETVSLAAFM